MTDLTKNIFTDTSKIVTESLVRSGADVFIGYPITPANLIYSYSSKRFPIFLAAPDEITTLQWMSGFSATGKIPVTATSFPGYALMIESINMAFMMELPMVIILVQRLGPATGTATSGAQGDINVINGTISGGMSLPCFSISNPTDCWEIPHKAVETAVKLRTPVILLTSKEEVMTMTNINLNEFRELKKVDHQFYKDDKTYIPYEAGDSLVSQFLPLINNQHQVRMTASTHNQSGIIQNTSHEALNNSKRLHHKMIKNLPNYTLFDFDEQQDADILIISYGITAQAGREAVIKIRGNKKRVSHLIAKTLFPVSNKYFEIAKKYKNIIVAEENLTGLYSRILFGANVENLDIISINDFGKMISPDSIIEKVMKYD